jgi:hypothetical protein
VIRLISTWNARRPVWALAVVAIAAETVGAVRLAAGGGTALHALALPLGISVTAAVLGILADLEMVAPWKATFTLGAALICAGLVLAGLTGVACLLGGVAVAGVAVTLAGTEDPR